MLQSSIYKRNEEGSHDVRPHRSPRTTRLAQVIDTAPTTAAAGADSSTPDDTDEERVQLEIAQQVRTSNAEEETLHPTEDVESTKATHGAEITQIDARIEQLDNKMRREITSVSAAKVLEFKEGDFKEG